MHIALWIVQALLALVFIGTGFMKASAPIEELAAQMAWVQYFPDFMVRFIGIAEVAGGLGLILPSLLRIKPKLTPLAASGLVAIMLGALGTHVLLGEWTMVPPAFLLIALPAFVAWGRLTKAPITPRS